MVNFVIHIIFYGIVDFSFNKTLPKQSNYQKDKTLGPLRGGGHVAQVWGVDAKNLGEPWWLWLTVCGEIQLLIGLLRHDRDNNTVILILDEYKLLSSSGLNALGSPDNWFWRVGLVAHRFYCLEASPKGSSLERFPTLS